MKRIFIVGLEDSKYWCTDRTPFISPDNKNYQLEYKASLRSANNETTLLMMKHPIKRDMSQAKIVHTINGVPSFGGLLGYIEAPTYIDYDEIRKTPNQVWVIEAPTRYQAIKIA
jgi:hypothetical protein